MANPFGVVIDDEYLDKLPRYVGKPKTQEDRAREAQKVQTEGVEEVAKSYVEGVKGFYGDGVSTLCMIYNATGETLYYIDDHDYYGTLCRTPYPTVIGNGQCVSFLHVHDIGITCTSGSEAAVIYRGKQKDGFSRDFSLAWSTPFGPWYSNKAYCEMHEAGERVSWDELYNRTNNSDYTDEVNRDGMIINVSTAKGTSPLFTAVLTIPVSP